MVNPEEDGITHINVYSQGRTELGRLLSNFAHTPFVHAEDGHFASVEGYWYWLSARDERLRSVWGWEAKRLGRELGGSDWSNETRFRLDIKTAIDAKLMQTVGLLEQLRATSLPLVHYYVFGEAVVTPKQGQWILDHLDAWRKAQ